MLRGRFIPLMCDLWTEAKALEGRAPLRSSSPTLSDTL
jgi:hypothetical protein